MASFKRDKLFFGILVVIICSYFVYNFNFETNLYKVNYLPYNDFYMDDSQLILISNPPENILDQLNLIIENFNNIEPPQKQIGVYYFLEEKYYLNRFFTTLNLLDQDMSIEKAMQNERGDTSRINFKWYFFSNQESYISTNISNSKCNLIYFPKGYQKNSNFHWFFGVIKKRNDQYEKIFIPAVDNGEVINIDSLCVGLEFPSELLNPKNKDEWPLIYRQ